MWVKEDSVRQRGDEEPAANPRAVRARVVRATAVRIRAARPARAARPQGVRARAARLPQGAPLTRAPEVTRTRAKVGSLQAAQPRAVPKQALRMPGEIPARRAPRECAWTEAAAWSVCPARGTTARAGGSATTRRSPAWQAARMAPTVRAAPVRSATIAWTAWRTPSARGAASAVRGCVGDHAFRAMIVPARSRAATHGA
jgi:hypothetical protein